MAKDNRSRLAFEAGRVFTPGAPISQLELFAGRLEQVNKIMDTISQTGYHAVLYGERGVGKTSLANVLFGFARKVEERFQFPRVNCNRGDTFTTLWKKLFQDLKIVEKKPGVGLTAGDETIESSVSARLPETLTPDDVRRALQSLASGKILVPIFDEFDRLANDETAALMADTIKALSDFSIPATIILIGVAESVDELIEEHHSIERVLSQIPMPRMSREEVGAIVDNGLKRLKVKIGQSEKDLIVELSQGLPYVTHQVALHTTVSAIRRGSREIEREDVGAGISIALDKWQQSISAAYYIATKSQQPGNIFKQVVLACAFAATDDFGYFSAANVRESLRLIVPEKKYDIPHFARHLRLLSGTERGNLLSRTGQTRRVRYRFSNPIMPPFIIMRGFSDGLITRDLLGKMSKDLGTG